MLVLSNTFSRIGFGTWLGESGGVAVQQSQDTVVLGNLFQRDPNLSGTFNIAVGNDGETIMSQTGHNTYPCHGYVSSATSTTLTDTTKNWTNNYGAPDDNGMYYVTIVGGPGTGQIREVISNGTNTLTVDSPWQVIPGSSSVYSVNHLEALRHLVKDNRLNNGVIGIEYYSLSSKDTAIVNNTLTDCGGIYFRSDYRPPTTNRFQIQMDTFVAGNSVTRTSSNPYTSTDSYAYIIDWLYLTGTDHAPGTSSYCTEFRGNTITAPVPSQKSGLIGEGFGMVPQMNNGAPLTDGTTVAAVGTIFQGNTTVSCSNAFHLCTGDYFTTLWNNSVSGTGTTLLYDGTGSGISHGSMANTYGTLTSFWTFNSQNGQDSSGNLSNGTPINSPVFSTDVPFSTSGNAYSVQFTGSNRIEVPSSAIINPGNELTVAFWMKSGTNGYGYGRLISKDGESTSSPGWLVQRNNGGTSIAIRLDTSAGANQMTTITNVLDNTWHYIAFVVNNGSVTAYKDGALVTTRTYNVGGGFMNTGVPLEIGSGNAGSGLLTGMVDEVRLFDAALSASQISALYNTR